MDGPTSITVTTAALTTDAAEHQRDRPHQLPGRDHVLHPRARRSGPRAVHQRRHRGRGAAVRARALPRGDPKRVYIAPRWLPGRLAAGGAGQTSRRPPACPNGFGLPARRRRHRQLHDRAHRRLQPRRRRHRRRRHHRRRHHGHRHQRPATSDDASTTDTTPDAGTSDIQAASLMRLATPYPRVRGRQTSGGPGGPSRCVRSAR